MWGFGVQLRRFVVVFGYSPEDRITSQKQGTVQTHYTFDVLGRRYQDKVGTTVKTVRHYMDETDNPSWVTGTGTAAGQIDVYSSSLSSGLSVTRKTIGTTTTNYMSVGNLHGDTIISLQLPATGFVTGPSELNVYDEYGLHQAPENDNRPVGIGNYADTSQLFVLTYGSLGQPQRETTDTGIQFMGARGYNPITGQFLSPDPVQGGNETPYNYPNDPINVNDISGFMGFWQTLGATVIISLVAIALVGAICAATAGAGCLVSGLVINGIAGLTAGAIEADSQGLKGKKRTTYMLESAGISAVAFGAGRVVSKVAGQAMLASRDEMRSWATNQKWFKATLKIASSAVPSLSTKETLKYFQNHMYAQVNG